MSSPTDSKPTVLDLFSGVGGFALAFERAGFETVAFSEIEPFPCRVLSERWPDVPNLGDISKITEEQLDALGEIDVVTFGSPCQDFSVAGKRLGMKGHRSSLFHEAIRVIRHVRPRFALWENVPGVFSSAGGWDFAAVLDEMAESGALDIAWSVLDAQWFGVPQRRRRVFVVADFRGERAGEILSISEGVCRDSAPSREAGPVPAALTSNGVGTCGADDNQAQGGHLLAESFAFALRGRDEGARVEVSGDRTSSIRGEGGSGRDYVAQVSHALTAEGHDASEDRTGRGTPLVPVGFHSTQDPVTTQDGTPCLGTGNSKGYGHRAVAFAENQRGELRTSETHPQLTTGGGKPGQGYPVVAFETGQGWWNEGQEAGTLRAEGENRPSRPSNVVRSGMAVRRLTPKECERLQGFPDDFTNMPGASDSGRYKAMGNSVAVPVVHWIAERIRKELL